MARVIFDTTINLSRERCSLGGRSRNSPLSWPLKPAPLEVDETVVDCSLANSRIIADGYRARRIARDAITITIGRIVVARLKSALQAALLPEECYDDFITAKSS